MFDWPVAHFSHGWSLTRLFLVGIPNFYFWNFSICSSYGLPWVMYPGEKNIYFIINQRQHIGRLDKSSHEYARPKWRVSKNDIWSSSIHGLYMGTDWQRIMRHHLHVRFLIVIAAYGSNQVYTNVVRNAKIGLDNQRGSPGLRSLKSTA